jgi:formate hydrogenlyase transcriptional activator
MQTSEQRVPIEFPQPRHGVRRPSVEGGEEQQRRKDCLPFPEEAGSSRMFQKIVACSKRLREVLAHMPSAAPSNMPILECLPFPQEAGSSRMFQKIVAGSKRLQKALAHLPSAAASNMTILITGESGTGKELLACAIHRLSQHSPRAFVRINCATIQPQLIASELFGQRKGRRSPKTQPRLDCPPLAEGGTIFLQGVDDLTGEGQLALLGALRDIESLCSDRSRGPRLIATTCRDLRAASDEGTFLRGLFYRLNEFAITLPPLRERKEDIPALARHFLAEYFLGRGTVREKKQRPVLTERSLNLLQSYPWPGNMRELQRVMERFAVLSEANILSVEAKWVPWESVQARRPRASASGMPMPNETELLEAALIEMLAMLPGWEPGNLVG